MASHRHRIYCALAVGDGVHGAIPCAIHTRRFTVYTSRSPYTRQPVTLSISISITLSHLFDFPKELCKPQGIADIGVPCA